MATEFFYPISSAPHNIPAGFEAEWTLGAGGNYNVAVLPGGGRAGPMTHDDATTYINRTHNGLGTPFEQGLNPDMPGPIGNISAITLAYQTNANAPTVGREQGFVNVAGTKGSSLNAVNNADATWTTTGPTDASGARPGGGSWVSSDFANDQTTFLFVQTVSGTGNCNVTSVFGELTYETPTGGFVFLLGLAGLLSLQMVGPMTDYTQFEKFLQWRHDSHPRHTILSAPERVLAWDEYKSYTHPRFFYG
jgi:hypothetical protein